MFKGIKNVIPFTPKWRIIRFRRESCFRLFQALDTDSSMICQLADLKMAMNASQLKKALKPFKMGDSVLEGYLHLYKKFQQGPKVVGRWKSLRSPDAKKLVDYKSLPIPERASLESALARLAVCKLNGGLGTSMGCPGAKSAIVVRDKKTFLDLIAEQVGALNKKYQADVPLIFMNSFHSHDETERIVGKYMGEPEVLSFRQNQYPRLLEDDSGFLNPKKLGSEAWYPPGHGDLYSCLFANGYLDRLLKEGREYLFISNADNLGATVDLKILDYVIKQDVPFLMEVTPKTVADTKGGTLYMDKDHIKLLEVANVPVEHIPEFCGQGKFKIFNTNNIWVNLAQLKELLKNGPLDLDVIVNRKQVKNAKVIQLETAVGMALNSFPGAVGLTVPRGRFLPVKKTSDLLLVQSDLFSLDRGALKRDMGRTESGLPRISLEDPFNDLKEYQKRIPIAPDITELDSLEIQGQVRFSGRVTLKGKVRLVSGKKTLRVPKGAVLENKVVEQ